ncbi:MAG: bifunctional phosphopantothenoylcysteine decarboxylase/phosphopantothenate--cysteine ligase CoaBC [Chloroflexia bacterium]
MLLHQASVVLGVTGGIAAYKAADLASKLVQAGAAVDVVMTEAATHFVGPLTFQALTGRPVHLDPFRLLEQTEMPHLSLAQRAHVLVIAPATANTLAKLAHGIADNLLCAVALATRAPLVLAPAMDTDMWEHPATQENLETLRRRGAWIVGPGEGRLASGRIGRGRMAEVPEILGTIRRVLGREGPLSGKRVLVTAGGTQEPLDPVRYIGNRSSGKMGYALAQTALDRGAAVTLVTAPTALPTPVGAERVEVRTAEEMRAAVLAALPQCDILVMAAAVADFRPAEVSGQKIKKGKAGLTLHLERTPDILAEVAAERERSGRPALVIGFAAETEDLLRNARAKLEGKRLDLIVANDVSSPDSGFGVDTNRVVLLDRYGLEQALPLLPKEEVAGRVWEWVVEKWEQNIL